MRRLLLIVLGLIPALSNATALAVSLQDLYLKNNTPRTSVVKIQNLNESSNIFSVPAHGMCKVPDTVMFLPIDANTNNYIIQVDSNGSRNPIVIDRFGLLTLAYDSVIKVSYQGDVKQYALYGFCGNRLGQSKFLNVTPHNNESEAPNFVLANCNDNSNYVYLINTQYVKVANKTKYIDFSHIGKCESQ